MSAVMWSEDRHEGYGGGLEQISGNLSGCGRSSSLLEENHLDGRNLSFLQFLDDESTIYSGLGSFSYSNFEEDSDQRFLSRLSSLRLEDENNALIEPYGIWGAPSDETITSSPGFVLPSRIYPEPVDSLYNQSLSLWENSADSQFQRLSFDSNDQWDVSALIEMRNSPQINPSDVRNDRIVQTNTRILRSPRSRKPSIIPVDSLTNIQGSIVEIAKDQNGCRHLQRILDKGAEEEREMIFSEMICHVSDLMVHPFGNYLVQKVLDVCSEEQRFKIVSILANNPSVLLNIALNVHGTRALQKVIEVLKKEEEMGLIMSAIQCSFLDLVTDPSGNHVVQRCLRCFSYDQNKFIFEAAARYCMEIATDRHGCCILQQCIDHAIGDHKMKLLEQVCLNGLTLAQDASGNYVVQFILKMRDDWANEMLKMSLKGNYAQLSMQKYSSNVVEKCLRLFDEAGRKMIVSELLSVPSFDDLMRDPFANYVIQSALLVCKGQVRNALAHSIRSRSSLRSNQYCRGIFNLLKK